jgi:hypothetical protein
MKGYPARQGNADDMRKLKLLIEHFAKAAYDEHHASRMIEWVLENREFCPEVKHLHDAAKATSGANVTEGDKPRYRECARCVEGFVQVFQHARWSQDRRPTAGFVYETIADDIHPKVTEHEFRREIGKYLTSQQHARFETLFVAFPPSWHSRFTLGVRRCPRCWAGRAAA